MPFEDMMAAVSNVPPDSIILLLILVQDVWLRHLEKAPLPSSSSPWPLLVFPVSPLQTFLNFSLAFDQCFVV